MLRILIVDPSFFFFFFSKFGKICPNFLFIGGFQRFGLGREFFSVDLMWLPLLTNLGLTGLILRLAK